MKTPLFLCIALVFVALVALAPRLARAQTVPELAGLEKISYPIKALGNCDSQGACETYCDSSDHMQACVAFAEKQGLLSGDDLRMAKLVADKVAKKETPGGCNSRSSCESYCSSNSDAIISCVSFGEELGVLKGKELEQAKKVAKAIKDGAKLPGNCTNQKSCEAYCSVSKNIDSCLSFAEKAGFLSGPELEQAKKVAPFLKDGKTPGGCTSKDSCENYCKIDTNFNECIDFAEKAGFVSKEDAEMARKVGGNGPGGCKGKEECATYCADESHAEACLSFAMEKGLLSEEEKQQVNETGKRIREGVSQIPEEARPEVEACLKQVVGDDNYANIMGDTGKFVPTQKMGAGITQCFQNVAQIMMKSVGDKMKAKYMDSAPSGNVNAPGTQGIDVPEPKDIQEMINGAGGPPSAEAIQNMIKNAGGPPSAEDIQRMMQGAGVSQ